ncbi:MAG: hypothetical protein M1337_03450, partial [Actinobacteria bacterium]|nr:hypothetical protein [Actinomycetota bacterium]
MGIQPGEGAGRRVRVRGSDTVKGGPTVNQLAKRARTIGTKIRNVERRQAEVQRQRAEEGADDYVSTDGRTAPSTVSSGDPRVLPEKMRDLADLRKKWDKNPQRKRDKEKWEGDEKVPIDYRALMADKSNGGIGYTGRSGAEIFNWRQAEHNRFADEAQNVELAYRPTCNYLSRVLRTLMQNADRKGYRDGERSGLLDKRRAYQMGAARFDVFRQPPNPRDNRPIVLLTTDCSGSMDGGYGLNRETRAFHAMAATLVLAGSLHRLGIPFESHAFDSLIYIT